MAVWLQRATVPLNEHAETVYGTKITNFALRRRQQSAVDVCRKELKISPGSERGGRPPMYDVMQSGLQSELMLLKKMHNINEEKDEKGKTALLIAAEEGDVRGMRLALFVSLSLVTQDSAGCNLLHCAVSSRCYDAVAYAVSKAPAALFAQENNQQQTPWALAESIKLDQAVALLKSPR